MHRKPGSTRTLRPTVVHAAALAALLAPLHEPAGAVTVTWLGGSAVAPTSWANPRNWSTGLLPPSADDTALLFPNSFVLATNDIAAGFRLNQIRAFDNGGTGGNGTIGGQAITLAGAGAQLFVGAAGSLVINAPLSGSVAFSKTGTGELSLGGNNLALAGDLTVAAGRLNALSSGNLGSGAVTVNAGATLRSGGAQFIGGIAGAGSWQNDGATTLTVASGERSFSGSVTGSATLTKSGAGRQVFGGSVTSGGPVTVGGGELALAGSGASWVGATALSVANAATASVSGGARFATTGAVTVGGGSAFASGTLAVDGAGSALTSNGATLGSLAGSSGTLALDRGGSFAAGLMLTVGAQGTGAVSVAGGGLLSAATAVIGQGQGSSGSVALSGAGSTWNTSNAVTVGSYGQGTLSLDGAQGSANGGMVLGAELPSSGTMSLANSASWAVNAGTFVVGMRGTGTVEVAGGSLLSTQGAAVGLVSGSGQVKLSGGGQWINSGTMVIGSGAPGTLLLDAGGRLSSGSTTLGIAAQPNPADKSAIVRADGATWSVDGELRMSEGGWVDVRLGGGTQLSSSSARIGAAAGARAEVSLDGQAGRRTVRRNPGSFVVGDLGGGLVSLESGASLETGPAVLGAQAGGGGTVYVKRSAINASPDLPSWNVQGSLTVGGGGGVGMLSLSGGSIRSGPALIGAFAGSSGLAIASGTASAWDIAGDLTIGNDAAGRIGGELRVLQGAQVRSTGTLTLRPDALVTLGSQSLLSVATIATAVGAQLNWTGGTLEITGPAGATLGTMPYLGRVLSLAGDQTLAVTHTLDVGSGTIVLSDAATVRAGTISLAGGQIVGRSVLELGHSTVSGWGIVGIEAARGATDSSVEAKGGTLMIGDPNSGNGFSSLGKAVAQPSSRLVLVSGGIVTLPGTVTLEAGSQLQTLFVGQLPSDAALEAKGTAGVLGRFVNFGQVKGPTDSAAALSFNDDVSGPGSFTGNVRFLQHYTPEAGARLQNLSLADTATLVLGDLGAAARSASPLHVTGLAELGGRLQLQLASGFTPGADGAVFELLDWGQFSGSFASFTVDGLAAGFTGALRYDADALRLSISAVPEPASWLAMLGGAALLLARRRLRGRRAD